MFQDWPSKLSRYLTERGLARRSLAASVSLGVVVVETPAGLDAQPSAVHITSQQPARSFRDVIADGGIVLFNRQYNVKPNPIHQAEGRRLMSGK